MKINPYEKKRLVGVKGTVPDKFDSINIYDKTKESIVIFVGKLENKVYDFGFEIHLLDGTKMKRLPGVGNGWFKEYHDANAYAAYAIKIGFGSRLSKEAVLAIDFHIQKIRMPQLDII